MTERELMRLAADRSLRTPELHRTNDYYGNAAVLKRFAGLPARRALKAVVEHGLPVGTEVWEQDLDTTLPVFLCSSHARARVVQAEMKRGSAIPIGPILEYAEPDRAPRPGRRLLAFPAHSTHHTDAIYDTEVFASRLGDLARDFDALTVCIYWKEILRGMHRPYLGRGFECVTSGHMYDADFLRRLRSYLDEADAVVTNQMGSHLLYAASRGMPVALLRQPMAYQEGDSIVADAVRNTEPRLRPFARAKEQFGEELAEPTAPTAEFVEELVGRELLCSPARMRAILEDADERRSLSPKRQQLLDRLRWLKHEIQARIELGRLTRLRRQG